MTDSAAEQATLVRPAADRGPVGRALRLLPDILAALAEGAWLSVIAALLAAGAHETAHLGPLGFAIAAIVGLVAGRTLGSRPNWPVIAVVLTFAAGAAGWLATPEVRDAVGRLDLGAASGNSLGSWLAAVAFLRGTAHAHAAGSRGAMERLIAVALPGLAIPILIGGAMSDPWRSRFIDDARIGTVLFLIAGTVGVGVARLAALRGPAGFDWRGNRAWLLLLVVLVLAISLIALPAAGVVGPAVQVAIAALLLPALALGTIAGFRQVSRRAVLIYLVVFAVLLIGVTALSSAPKLAPQAGPGEDAGQLQAASDPTAGYAIVGIALVVVFVLAVLFLARLWSRDALARQAGDVPEERWIDTGEPTAPQARFGPWRRRSRPRAPASAAEAYLAALEDLERLPDARRRPAESPAEHAARLRGTVHGALALDLLAADYEIVRFGASPLTPAEDRRAIGRWRRLRER